MTLTHETPPFFLGVHASTFSDGTCSLKTYMTVSNTSPFEKLLGSLGIIINRG